MPHTPISFSSSFLAATCSSVLTFTLYFSGSHGRADGLRADLHEVRPSLQHRAVVHPDDGRLELVGDGRRRIRRGEHITPAHIDFVRKRQRNGLPGR